MTTSIEFSNSSGFMSPTTITASSYIETTREQLTRKSSSNSTLIIDDDNERLSEQNINEEKISVSTEKGNMTIPNEIHIGGRKSKLAVAQSLIVKSLIKTYFPKILCPVLALTTLGDQVANKPLYSFGGKSLWTKELEVLLLQDLGEYHKLDLVVHSLKDVPTNLPDEFELGCITKREDPSDALIMAKESPYRTLADLPDGSVVGTSSVRRSSQLKRHFPYLRFESIRGSLQTRLAKLDDPTTNFKCIILATAGLVRVGLDHRITQRLDSSIMMHSVGQGALGIEIRKGDETMKSILAKIEDKQTTVCCLAERSLMRTLEGGCSVPIGVWTNYDVNTHTFTIKGMVNSVDGKQVVQDEVSSQFELVEGFKSTAEEIGVQLANKLISKGAKVILDEINFDKINERDE
ncbi:hypothetical protein WICMUC_003330 [Wickerhamomyces mucosus]|uniref:Porphobilinogen deaminase n=1 Tax=Wickerhamomyces mucosus TaxID=1378264 RepID=A0A9P8PM05_9ASCO|nr:hypothetical protein WICMUC_003330 [Wickerhamomyces mucosus]